MNLKSTFLFTNGYHQQDPRVYAYGVPAFGVNKFPYKFQWRKYQYSQGPETDMQLFMNRKIKH
jgi:hypothetical protein